MLFNVKFQDSRTKKKKWAPFLPSIFRNSINKDMRLGNSELCSYLGIYIHPCNMFEKDIFSISMIGFGRLSEYVPSCLEKPWIILTLCTASYISLCCPQWGFLSALWILSIWCISTFRSLNLNFNIFDSVSTFSLFSAYATFTNGK